MPDLKAGSVVQLKSGGPKMTYSGEKDEDGQLYCQWFVNDKLQTGYFISDMLIVLEDEEMGGKV